MSHREVAIVTGAAGGMGAAIAGRLAEDGLVVVASDTNAEGLAEVAEKLRAGGHVVHARPLDLRSSAAVEQLVAEAEQIGPIRSLVNAAGVLRMGPTVEFSDEDWAATFDVNVTGTFRISRAVARRMIPRGRGGIVSVASNAAHVARKSMAAYGASKAAMESFTKSLGLELAEHGIRCNVIAPGSTESPMLRAMLGPSNEAVIGGSLADHKIGIPLRKVAQPADIANAAAFLLSDFAAHITMHTLVVDGGATLGV